MRGRARGGARGGGPGASQKRVLRVAQPGPHLLPRDAGRAPWLRRSMHWRARQRAHPLSPWLDARMRPQGRAGDPAATCAPSTREASWLERGLCAPPRATRGQGPMAAQKKKLAGPPALCAGVAARPRRQICGPRARRTARGAPRATHRRGPADAPKKKTRAAVPGPAGK